MQHIKRLLGDRSLLFIALCYTCTISVLFFMPSPELPKIQISGADKIIHGFIYFILINMWLLYFYKKMNFRFKAKWVLILLISILLYGIIIEIFQGLFTASRSADIFDIAANFVGSLLGIFFFRSIKHKFNF